jgi:hypothetical protein
VNRAALYIQQPTAEFAIDWHGPCDNCDDTNAHWFQNPRGTGLADPVVYCPTCKPRRTTWPSPRQNGTP